MRFSPTIIFRCFTSLFLPSYVVLVPTSLLSCFVFHLPHFFSCFVFHLSMTLFSLQNTILLKLTPPFSLVPLFSLFLFYSYISIRTLHRLVIFKFILFCIALSSTINILIFSILILMSCSIIASLALPPFLRFIRSLSSFLTVPLLPPHSRHQYTGRPGDKVNPGITLGLIYIPANDRPLRTEKTVKELRDTFKLFIGNLVMRHTSTGILTRIALRAILVKIPVLKCVNLLGCQ